MSGYVDVYQFSSTRIFAAANFIKLSRKSAGTSTLSSGRGHGISLIFLTTENVAPKTRETDLGIRRHLGDPCICGHYYSEILGEFVFLGGTKLDFKANIFRHFAI